jgi:hypothetical protein
MWTAYVTFCKTHMFLAAFIQFLVLGTLGEVLSVLVRTGNRRYPFSAAKTVLKAVGWGLLGIYIKGMFLAAGAGTSAIAGALSVPLPGPEAGLAAGIALALATSTVMNVMMGPSMMLLHRLEDNAIDRLLGHPGIGWTGLDKSMATLIWLWIPLHTFTFTQAPEVRIGIAAVLSMVLGIVMGWTARTSGATRQPQP